MIFIPSPCFIHCLLLRQCLEIGSLRRKQIRFSTNFSPKSVIDFLAPGRSILPAFMTWWRPSCLLVVHPSPFSYKATDVIMGVMNSRNPNRNHVNLGIKFPIHEIWGDAFKPYPAQKYPEQNGCAPEIMTYFQLPRSFELFQPPERT